MVLNPPIMMGKILGIESGAYAVIDAPSGGAVVLLLLIQGLLLIFM